MSDQGGRSAPRRAHDKWRDQTISHRLDPRDNSLNLIRLLLACTVLFAHSFTLSGNGFGPLVNGEHLGTWSVYMFFCLSGFLITGSRLRGRFGPYLINRIARLYPAFVVSLVLVAFVFAPIVFLHEHGTLDGFLTTLPTPFQHVYFNLRLWIIDFHVGDTLSAVPYPGIWNGSLWSLYFEFLCYLIVGGLLAIGVLRRHPITLVPVFALAVWCAAHAESLLVYCGTANGEIALLLPVLPFFLGGAALYAVRDHVPLTWWIALPSLAAFAGLVTWQGTWGPHAGAPLLTLFLLWLGTVVPSPRWVQHNDISYGCYIYAFPSQQLMAAFGGADHGTYVLAALAAPLMFCLALASWFVIERPAMRAVRGHHPARNEGDLAPEDAPVPVFQTDPTPQYEVETIPTTQRA